QVLVEDRARRRGAALHLGRHRDLVSHLDRADPLVAVDPVLRCDRVLPGVAVLAADRHRVLIDRGHLADLDGDRPPLALLVTGYHELAVEGAAEGPEPPRAPAAVPAVPPVPVRSGRPALAGSRGRALARGGSLGLARRRGGRRGGRGGRRLRARRVDRGRSRHARPRGDRERGDGGEEDGPRDAAPPPGRSALEDLRRAELVVAGTHHFFLRTSRMSPGCAPAPKSAVRSFVPFAQIGGYCPCGAVARAARPPRPGRTRRRGAQPCCGVRACCASSRTSLMRSSGSNGLVMYASTPRESPRCLSASCARAVSRITLMCRVRSSSRSRVAVTHPSSRGIITSRVITSGRTSSTRSRQSCPSQAVSTSNPSRVRLTAISCR